MQKKFTIRPLVWLMTVLLAIGPLASWAQTLTENFDTGAKASYAAAPVVLASGSWAFNDAVMGNSASDRFNGVQGTRIRGGSIAMNFDKPNGAGTVTLNAAQYGNDAASSFILEYSTDGGTTYTAVTGAPAALTTTLTPYSFTVNKAGNIRLRISNTNTVVGANPRINVDDVVITDAAAATTATVTATPTTLTAFTTAVGTASATQTLSVGGSALTAGVVVTAPAGYEVSLSAATSFAASVTVPQTAGTAAVTPVYVRLTGTTAGTYAGNVTVASTGATTVSVAVTGTVTAATPTPAPTITSFTPASAPAGATVTITGTNFTNASAVTLNGVAITGFAVVNATTITFVVPATAASGTIAVTTPGGTATSSTSLTVTAPVAVPVISSFAPARTLAGSPEFELTITGTNLTGATAVSFNGGTYTPTSATATSIKVTIPATAVTKVGVYPITVTTAGGVSNALTYLIVAPATVVSYEDFEQGDKTGYAAGDVTLRSGVWTFTDALIGDLFNDRVNQVKSARVRGAGTIAMKFDKATGAGVVTILAAAYGTDTPGFFKAEVSSDGGATYTALTGDAANPTVLTTTLAPFAFTVNRAGNVRLRFSATGTGTTPRINFDDLTITNFTASATLASNAIPGLAVFPNPATDRLTVALPQAGAATVAVRDLTGRLVLAPAALAANREVRLPAGLAAGVYLLEVQQNSVTAIRRIQKN